MLQRRYLEFLASASIRLISVTLRSEGCDVVQRDVSS
jgi:hypothetical protein